MDIWTYVITHNHGSAPNFEGRQTTLAICKPLIRKNAQKDDVVLAFTGAALNQHRPHSVCWAGVVSEIIEIGAYWTDKRFVRKRYENSEVPDNIYESRKDGTLVQVPNSSHRAEETERDTSGHYVLIFRQKWHFGENGPALPKHFGLRMEANSRRGHRQHKGCDAVWPGLQQWLDEQTEVGPPTSSTACSICGPRRHVHHRSVRKKCSSVC